MGWGTSLPPGCEPHQSKWLHQSRDINAGPHINTALSLFVFKGSVWLLYDVWEHQTSGPVISEYACALRLGNTWRFYHGRCVISRRVETALKVRSD